MPASAGMTDIVESYQKPCDEMQMRERPVLLLIASLVLTGCTNSELPPPLQLRVGTNAKGDCTLSLDGRALNADELVRAFKNRGSREVHLLGMDMTVPFRCIGPAIAALQKANVPMKVGFISEPASAAMNTMQSKN